MSDQSTPVGSPELALGTPSIGASPTPLDPNGMYVVPGIDGPIKGASIKDGFMSQAHYTQGQQTTARERQELAAEREALREAAIIAQALAEDFDDTVEQLRPMYQQARQGQQQQTQQPTQQQQAALPPEVQQFMREQAQRLEATERQLYGFMAHAQIAGEQRDIEARDPRLKDDAGLRADVHRIAAEKGLSIEDAWKLKTFDEHVRRVAEAEAEKQAIEMRRFMPTLGGASRPTQAPLPQNSEEIWDQVWKEQIGQALKPGGFLSTG